MSLELFELKPGALLIADAHYSDQRPKLIELLQSVYDGNTTASQLILMGDIFDLLFGPIALTYERNKEAIEIINAIAMKIEVLYLEGNHDFLLKRYFPEIYLVPLSSQPLHVRFKDQDILLAHGDFGSHLKYRLYTMLIRSRMVLSLLNVLDWVSAHRIIHYLDDYLEKKDDCYKIEAFEDLVKERLEIHSLLDYDGIIEGHFHQNTKFDFNGFNYINLAAFACNERYFVVKSSQEALELEEFRLR